MSARTREPWWKMRLPKEIGPHEGIEFKLIEQGKKDLALLALITLRMIITPKPNY